MRAAWEWSDGSLPGGRLLSKVRRARAPGGFLQTGNERLAGCQGSGGIIPAIRASWTGRERGGVGRRRGGLTGGVLVPRHPPGQGVGHRQDVVDVGRGGGKDPV